MTNVKIKGKIAVYHRGSFAWRMSTDTIVEAVIDGDWGAVGHRKTKMRPYCVVPGCKNKFNRVRADDRTVNFHKLPLKWKTVLKQFSLKRENPPIETDSKVQWTFFGGRLYWAEHLWVGQGSFFFQTKRLMPGVALSFLNFTASNQYSTEYLLPNILWHQCYRREGLKISVFDNICHRHRCLIRR